MKSAEPEALVERLRAGEGVDVALPGGGRLHLDRPLPFLCVCRRPAGERWPDTEALLTSLAAWLIASARVAKSMMAKVEESERRANLTESRASGLEATVEELGLMMAGVRREAIQPAVSG